MSAPHVFLSFASDDALWVDFFTIPKWFDRGLGNEAVVKNYQAGDNLPFGNLFEWIEEQIGSADAFLAFISENYIGKKYPTHEWRAALTAVAARQIVFVPIVIDADGKEWWSKTKREGALDDLGLDFVYADFSVGGRPPPIVGEYPNHEIVNKIFQLTRSIRAKVLARRKESAPLAPHDGAGAPMPSPVRPAPPERPAVDVHPVSSGVVSGAPLGADSERHRQVLLLGNPYNEASADIKAAADHVAQALGSVAVRASDAWLEDGKTVSDALTRHPSLIVQPVRPLEAINHAPHMSSWLDTAAATEGARDALGASKIVIWVPASLAAGSQRLAETMRKRRQDAEPALRTDTPDALAHWVRARLHPDREALPVLSIEGLENANDPALTAVSRGFTSIVEKVVQPAPERWPFVPGTREFDELFSGLETDRAIIAVHDLNTGPAQGRSDAVKSVGAKLEEVMEATKGALKRSGREVRLFWTVLLLDKARFFPTYQFPTRRLDDWHLLHFQPAESGAGSHVSEMPLSAKMFCSSLEAWHRRTT